MNFYSFDEINAQHALLRFVREVLGCEIRNGRIQAVWRGGTGFNVAVDEDKWFDHKAKQGGGILQLCAISRFDNDPMSIQKAQELLGNWLCLEPKNRSVRKTYDYQKQSVRYQELVRQGYTETCKYTYTDESGAPAHFVVRMEHPTLKKQFIQCTPWSGSVKDSPTYLYNLPAIAQSSWAIVVEGEKDADTLIRLGFPATTCNNGSDHWKNEYTAALRGKDVTICRDNDPAGLDHAHLLLRSLAHDAKSLRLICPSNLPKGDVTDWLEQENGNKKKLLDLIKKAAAISPEEAQWSDEALALYRAKKANENPFANYTLEERTVRGKTQLKEIPRSVNEMIEDVHTRFLGFPRRLGDNSLFDHDRDTDKIEMLPNNASLFAWIGEKSHHVVEWKSGPSFVTKEELFRALMRNSRVYEKISAVPNYPMRPDVYYTFRDKLKASSGHARLDELMAFFCPEDEVSAVLMRAMLAAMMFYRPGIQRPCWIIDSKGGQAAGKTTFAELACYLYRTKPIKTNMNELVHDAKELNKRLVSVTGRNSMMLLVDNVRGVFDSPFFADLVTGFDISGKAPYGIGEETRPNDLTYVITSNSANVGSDMASRSFIFYVAQPRVRRSGWKSQVMDFIDRHRYEILGDIYDTLEKGEMPDEFAAKTRVPEFEAQVLYKIAGSRERYETVVFTLLQSRESANVDEELAVQAMELIVDGIRHALDITAEEVQQAVVFLRTRVINHWLKKSLNMDAQDLRNMVNTGRIKAIMRSPVRYPRNHNHSLCGSGVMFCGEKPTIQRSPAGKNFVKVIILGLMSKDTVKAVGVVEDFALSDEIATALQERAELAETVQDAITVAPATPALPSPAAEPVLETYDIEPPEEF